MVRQPQNTGRRAPHLIHAALDPPRFHIPNHILIGSAIFCRDHDHDRQTDQPTDHDTQSVTTGRTNVCSTVMCLKIQNANSTQNHRTPPLQPLHCQWSSPPCSWPLHLEQSTTTCYIITRHCRNDLQLYCFHNHDRHFSFNCIWTILSLWTVCCLSGLAWFPSLTCSKTELFEIQKSSGTGCLRARCASCYQPTVSMHWKKLKLECGRANTQPDGRPAEHRWRPLFNATKFGWRPLLDAVQ